MNTKNAVLVGIDQYIDESITPLNGAANDVRGLAGFLEHRLRFARVWSLTDEDLRRGKDVLAALSESVAALGEGDLLVFFFAGHGKSERVNGKSDQILLLHNANRKSLEIGYYNSFTLSLAHIEAITQKEGVRRLFIFDTCRLPIERELAESRDGEIAASFDGEETFRDCGIRACQLGSANSPLTILNGCANGQRAREVPEERRGLYALTLQEAIDSQLELGKPIVIDASFDHLIDLTMDKVATRFRVRRGDQKPTRKGPDLQLYGREDRATAEMLILLAAFEEQLAAGQLDQPVGENCRDTHNQLVVRGLPSEQQRELASRLQLAIDARRLARDREHDERLIRIAHQRSSEQCYLNYLSQCRLHEHDEEAERFLDDFARAREEAGVWIETGRTDTVSAYQDYLQRYPEGLHTSPARQRIANLLNHAETLAQERDGERRTLAISAKKALSAWRSCMNDAETDALRTEARERLVALEATDRVAWEEACAEDSEQAYANYLVEQLEGRFRQQAESCQEKCRQARLAQQEEDAEAARQSQLAHEKTERDALRHSQVLRSSTPLAAWRSCLLEAETEALGEEGKAEIQKLEAADQVAWEKARGEDSEQAYALYLAQQPEGTFRDQAESCQEECRQAKLAQEEEDTEAARQHQLAQEKSERDARRRSQVSLSSAPLAAWRSCLEEAETEALKAEGRAEIQKLETVDKLAAEQACQEDSVPSYYYYYPTQQPQGDYLDKAEEIQVPCRMAQEDDESLQEASRTDDNRDLEALWANLNKWRHRAFAFFRNEVWLWWVAKKIACLPVWLIRAGITALTVVAIGVAMDSMGMLDSVEEEIPVVAPAALAVGPSAAAPVTAAAVQSVGQTSKPVVKAKDEATSPSPETLALNPSAWVRWLEETKEIERSSWWNQAGLTPSKAQREWVKETILRAEISQWPRAQFDLAALYCSGRAAPQVARNTADCGKWFSEALANPQLKAGEERDSVAKGVAQAYDHFVLKPAKDASADQRFVQSVTPGLAAGQMEYPGLALRLAVTQACFQVPADLGAAQQTLRRLLQRHENSVEAADARRLLANWQAGKAVCR
jgi:hypothetical protein